MAFSVPVNRRLVNRILIIAATLFVAQSMLFLFSALGLGIDFVPLRAAGVALIHGHSVYTDPTFVYPPTAAVLFVPLAFGSSMSTFVAWLVTSMLALLVAAGLIARSAPARLQVPVFVTCVLALICGPVASFSFFLGNLSVLLVPLAVLILLAFHRERWLLACALLAVTLLLKPLLAPLLLVPAFRRRWRELGLTMLPAAGLLALAMLVVPGGRSFAHVLSYCLSGTNLHGQLAAFNLSLRGWMEAHHHPAGWGAIVSLLVAAVVAARLVGIAVRRGPSAISSLWLGNLLLLTTLLVGRISEVHFLLTVIAGVLLQVVLERSRFNLLLALPGLAMIGLPMQYLDLVVNPQVLQQSWQVAAELFLLAALVLSRRPAPRLAPTRWLVVAEPELAWV